jgi:hypothetical protein
LLPLNITTSAGEVFVLMDLSRAEFPMAAFLRKPRAAVAAPLTSPLS